MKELGVFFTDLHLHLNNVHLFESAVDQAIDYCKKNGLHYIFNGGDTFTSRKGQPQEVLKVFWETLERMRMANITMYAIVGNHDKTDYASSDSFLIPFQDHPALQLVEGADHVDVVEGLRVHMVSFFEDEMYKDMLSKCEILKGVKNILITHIGIDGAKMNSGLSLSAKVNASMFKEFDAVYVGHYHNKQLMSYCPNGSRKVVDILYTGSTYPHNFGEDNDKGLYVLSNDGSMKMIETQFPKFVTNEFKEIQEHDIAEVLSAAELVGNLRIKTEKISPIFRSRLEAAGVKVIVEKKELISLVEKTEVQQYDDQSLVQTYDEWANKRKIKDKEIGKELLINAIQR